MTVETKLSPWMNLQANLALSRNKVKNFTEFLDDYDAGGQKSYQYSLTDIAYSPSIVGGANLQLKPVDRLAMNLTSKYVGKQYLDNTQNENRKLNAFYTQDVSLFYSLNNQWSKNATLVLQVNNIFDKKYEPNGYTYSYIYGGELTTENFYFPMAGTNFMLALNITL
jgi:iron complex outermembrane receptor protein